MTATSQQLRRKESFRDRRTPAGESGKSGDSHQRTLEWAVIIYAASCVIEGSLFAAGSARESRYAAAVLCLVVVAHIATNRVQRFSNLSLMGLLGIFGMVALSTMSVKYPETAWYPESAWTRMGTFAGLFVASLALAIALSALGWKGIDCLRRGLTIGAIGASLLIVNARLRGKFVGADQWERISEGRTNVRASAGAADPNDIALALAVALPACISSKNRKVRIFGTTAIVVGIFLTGSRGGIVAMAAGGLAATILVVRASKDPLLNLLRSAALAVTALWIAWLALPEELTERIAAIPAELQKGDFTRRTSYWAAGWEQYGDRAFLGAGAGSSPYLNYEITGRLAPFHNMYISILVELGIVGSLFFLVAFAVTWTAALKFRSALRWPLVSLVTITVGTVALSWEYNKLLWLMLIMGGSMLSMADRESSTNRRESPDTAGKSRSDTEIGQ